MAKKLQKILKMVKELETHCGELAVDSQKMAKEIGVLHTDLAIARQKSDAGCGR
jgi:hypothetical protein